MQNTIFIAADAAEQETLEAGVYAILKRWEGKKKTEENYKAIQKEIFDFCRYWFNKNGLPLTKDDFEKIKLVCDMTDDKRLIIHMGE